MIDLKMNDIIKYSYEDEDRIELVTNPHIFIRGVSIVWRYDEFTGNFVKIYDKDAAKPRSTTRYEKYIALQEENEKLKKIIAKLNFLYVTRTQGKSDY